MIRHAAFAAALLIAAAPALADERSFPVGGFDRLALQGSPDVVVTTGAAPSVRATGEAAMLDRLDIRVEHGTLKVGYKHDGGHWSWNWSSHDHGRTRVTVTVPMLRAVDIAGSGDVVIDRVKVPDFDGSISGSGSLHLAALDAERSSLTVSGSGDVIAAGRCGAGKASIAGSGRLRLAGLKCATLSASIAGSGSIDAYATQTATLATMGSGDITLTGGARCTVSTAGSGKAKCS